MYYRISLKGYLTICVITPFSFAKGQPSFESLNQSAVYSQYQPKRTSADRYGTQKLAKTLTFIFITSKQKQLFCWLFPLNYDMQLFDFFKNISFIFENTENTSKQRKIVAFVSNCLVKMSLRLFRSISVFMNMVWWQCFWGSSED